MPELRYVDPQDLRLPPSRFQGADPIRLSRQISRFGGSSAGMPPLWVYESADGVLVIYNGVTRAVRMAKLAPGQHVAVEVIGQLRRACAEFTRVGDVIS